MVLRRLVDYSEVIGVHVCHMKYATLAVENRPCSVDSNFCGLGLLVEYF